MTSKFLDLCKYLLLLVFSVLSLIACQAGANYTNTPTSISTQVNPTPEDEITATLDAPEFPTTEPGIPLAASINGQGITLSEYQAELDRAKSASETGLISYSEEDVLQNLIDEVLLAQGAAEAGFIPDEDFLQSRLEKLNMDDQKIQNWQKLHGYTLENFQHAFSRAIAAAWMRDLIISEVSDTVEQVHARQILLYNADEAENIYAQLLAGTDFATLATQYDPINAGDLGWFPRGYLTVEELDDPIFSLQPGEFTQIIETMLGFHIVQMIERDPNHPLSPGAYQVLQIQAIENWLIERRNQSDIQILLS